MRYLVALYLLLLTVLVVQRIVRQAIRGQVDLFSIRNLFIAGFIVFQLTSAILGLAFFIFGDVEPTNFFMVPLIYAVMVTAFLWLLNWSYFREWSPLSNCSKVRQRVGRRRGRLDAAGIHHARLRHRLEDGADLHPVDQHPRIANGGGVIAAAAGLCWLGVGEKLPKPDHCGFGDCRACCRVSNTHLVSGVWPSTCLGCAVGIWVGAVLGSVAHFCP